MFLIVATMMNDEEKTERYIGLTDGTIKLRHSNHKINFANIEKINSNRLEHIHLITERQKSLLRHQMEYNSKIDCLHTSMAVADAI